MRSIKNKLFLVFLLLLIVEVISYFFYKLNLLEISHRPKLYLPNGEIPNDDWWKEEDIWGAWHVNNAKTRQKRSCYDVTYISNEVGARDSSFKINNSNDVILIGDSFAEGYGVNYNNTSQKHIEETTNLNVLNFGVSRNFGIVQYYLIYSNFAKNYKHNKLIIYFLPGNDFGENDYNNWKGSKRYRPYYKKIDENKYETFIPEEAKKNFLSQSKKVKKKFKDYFWTSGLFININYNYKIYRAKKKYGKNNFSGYFDSKLEQQKAAIYFINKIIEESKVDTYLVSIPRIQDYERLNNGEKLNEIYWINFLNNVSKKNDKFTFIDLINYSPLNLESVFLKCDGHWSKKGNEWAAKIISKEIIE